MDKFLRMRKVDPTGFFNLIKETIENMTKITNNHFLTPELSLNLITEECPLSAEPYTACPFPDPYWAFYWPGGQGLTRYLLDNKHIIKNKHVLDVGSGCGCISIAASKLGEAKSITAYDIDPIAAVAINLNAVSNRCKPKSIEIKETDILEISFSSSTQRCILVGDMFYEDNFDIKLMDWLRKSFRLGAQVFIGDPGRHSLFEKNYKEYVEQVAEYEISEEFKQINDLPSNSINVWKMVQ